MKTEKNPRGAGRPKNNNIEFQVRIAPELADYARAQPEGQSVFVAKLIENHAHWNRENEMLVQLKNESGEKIEESFTDMTEAAKFCIENAEYGILLYPENNEKEWDMQEWQQTLDYYVS